MKRINLYVRRYSKLLDILKTMPKDTSEHQLNAQKHRIRIKERSKFYSPGTVNIQVLGSGARGTSSAIYLFSEQARYLFNCGEGTQRLAHEHRTKLTRMEHIFLTRKSWHQVGGVCGLCLTLQEIGVPKINLHGPSGIDEIFDATKKFVVLRNMKVETPECKDGEFWEDSVLRVNYVPLHKTKSAEPETPIKDESKNDETEDWTEKDRLEYNIQDDNTDYYGYEEKNRYRNFNNNKESNENNSNSSKNPQHSYSKSTDVDVMSYICKLQPRPGTLNLEKCVELGVRPGPLLGRLKNGFDVTLPDGSIVKADDVRGSACPGGVFIFVDIPDESYLPALLENQRFIAHQAGCANEEDMALVVVHFSPQEVIENEKYKEWMDRFSPSTNHLIVNERNTFTGYFASHRIQRQLNELDSFVFPMLKEPHPYMAVNDMTIDVSEMDASPSKKFKIDIEGNKEDKFADYPELGIRSCFHLRPPKGFDRFKEPYSHPDKVMEETYENAPELAKLITDFKDESSKIFTRTKAERNKEFPKVTTFGTGSCIPNKTRNVSANLIQISADNCAIFDCGEGTFGQIVRFFGRDGADEILKNLRLIYISHLHADHHLGLINILNRRRKLTNDKVVLLAPTQINSFLSFYNYRIEEIFSTYELFPCSDLISWDIEESKVEALEKRLGLEKIQSCYVKHCPHSFGISITMKNEMKSDMNPKDTVKITYSGDTIPCEDLINIGMNSDILIHEATMEDDLWKEARIKMHSTVSQAIQVGKKMKARYLILTHFSQRYAKIPLIEDKVDKKNIAVAFDNMEVTLNDLPKMHLMYEPLKVMFADHFEQMENKTLRRRYIQERKIDTNVTNGNGQNSVKKFKATEGDG
ncbi:unnamed protein product [Chironomus riparius]|uniref:Zinc phosphodiesterase ELAC protein 2 n=1 Tax=Chironomus riparius TaxID=315576 RepID=A0A9N9RJW6_9DIPT|nr:unnamed protein product [Chironomus riparius]